jgi:hypothetical protein
MRWMAGLKGKTLALTWRGDLVMVVGEAKSILLRISDSASPRNAR